MNTRGEDNLMINTPLKPHPSCSDLWRQALPSCSDSTWFQGKDKCWSLLCVTRETEAADESLYSERTVSVKPSGLHFCCSCYLDMLRFVNSSCSSLKTEKQKVNTTVFLVKMKILRKKLCSNDSLWSYLGGLWQKWFKTHFENFLLHYQIIIKYRTLHKTHFKTSFLF